MNNSIKYLLVIASLLLLSCTSQDPLQGGQSTEVDQSDPSSPLKIQWATRLEVDREVVGSNYNQEYGDYLLATGDIGDPPTIYAFHKETGNLDWKYVHDGVVKHEINTSIMANAIYIGMCSDGIIGYDTDKNSILWEVNFDTFDLLSAFDMTVLNGYVYIVATRNYNSISEASVVFELNPLSGELRELYDSQVYYLSPVAVETINGNTTFYCNEIPRTENPLKPEDMFQNIISVDAATGELNWRYEMVTDSFASNLIHPPVVYEDIVITGGFSNIYAFDANTGEKLWQYDFDYPWAVWNNTNHLIYDDRLYVNNGQRDVTCLNPRTGELIWNNPQGGANCSDNMVYYEQEDLLVFSSWGYGSVMVLDALTGDAIHQELPYANSNYTNDVVYDEALDMFFTTTYKHAIGFTVSRP